MIALSAAIRVFLRQDLRIAIRYHLAPFTVEETHNYIEFRLKVAGEKSRIFTKDAVEKIFEQSSGISRLINSLCDLCLFLGFQEGAHQIDLPLVERACQVM